MPGFDEVLIFGLGGGRAPMPGFDGVLILGLTGEHHEGEGVRTRASPSCRQLGTHLSG